MVDMSAQHKRPYVSQRHVGQLCLHLVIVGEGGEGGLVSIPRRSQVVEIQNCC